MPDLNNKLGKTLERLMVCTAKHQGNPQEWIEGRCITPSQAKSAILELINQEKEALVDEIMDVAMDMGHDYELTIVLQKYELKSRREELNQPKHAPECTDGKCYCNQSRRDGNG